MIKVLIVDDNPDNVELVCQVLEDHYATIGANNGEDCLALAVTEQPHLILLDVMMPEMDGYEVLDRLQGDERTAAIPVIFLTARYKDIDRIVKGLTLGAFDYITKPFEDDILLARVGVAARVKLAEEKIKKQKLALEERVKDLASAQDENRIVNKELAHARDEALQATRIKSEFLANMSHELRTPLHSIIGFTGILRDGVTGPVNEEQFKQLSMAYNSSQHLLELINDVLDLSKIEAGKVTVVNEYFDVGMLSDEIKVMFQQQIDKKNLQMRVNIDDTLELIYSDRIKLRQVLINLLGNAVKFTEQGSIDFSCKRVDDIVRFKVSDTGVGISAEQQKLIFDPFQQVGNSENRQNEGTGLGLAINKRYVEMLGSKLEVDSEPGVGSTFYFDLRNIDSEIDEEGQISADVDVQSMESV